MSPFTPSPPSSRFVVAADGGNSKTDIVLATDEGTVLSRVRTDGTHPHHLGVPATAAALWKASRQAVRDAGLDERTRVGVGAFYLANVDLPAEEGSLARELRRLAIAETVHVRNDVFAVLRAGTSRNWGVAVVSGAGINAVGVHPDGREERFLALGEISGDWGGGDAVGMAGLGAAIRAGDGRGPATRLRRLIVDTLGAEPEDVAVAVDRGAMDEEMLQRLAPVVFQAASSGDFVATTIVVRLADEAVSFADALLRRLDLRDSDADVILGGGMLQSGNAVLMARIREQLLLLAPRVHISVLDVAPVAGALAAALQLAGATPSALARARASLATPPVELVGK